MRAACIEQGVGLCLVAGRVGKARIEPGRRYFYDNGAFTRFRAGLPVDEEQFERDVGALVALRKAGAPEPDFAILPDVVGDGPATLALSMRWLDKLGPALPWAIAVQDGLEPASLPWDAPFRVVFVGGSMPWKLRTGAAWARAAHEHGRLCHVGRIGSFRGVIWALDSDADSIDSCKPLWSWEKWRRFTRGLASAQQERWLW